MYRVLPYDSILIPKEAVCVFRGEIFSVYQWQQIMFDGTTATFEMLKRPDTTIAIAIRDHKIVLLQEKEPGQPSVFHFPGGRVDPGDKTWLDTAQRETREETGMSFRSWKLVDVSQPATKIEWFVAWYIASDVSEETLQTLDPGEQIDVINETPDNAVRIVLNTNPLEAKYIPKAILNAKTVQDLMNIPEFIGDRVGDDI